MKIAFILLATLAFSCGKKGEKKEQEVLNPEKLDELVIQYKSRLAAAKEKAKDTHGWLEVSECDAMLWAGKYACGGGDPVITAAEYEDAPGKFNRRPKPYCGEPFGNSKTTWSRDMGMGLMSYGWCKKNREILERHASYGKKVDWIMGEPLADGRVVYSPSTIGILYEVIYQLGGEDNQARKWPSIYTSGLDDYQAHLQMIDIWLRSEMNNNPRDINLEISQPMYQRIKEHSDRQPECAFYHYMRGIFDGSLNRATELLLAHDKPQCDYMRGSPEAFESEWIFSAGMVLKKLKAIDNM